MASVKNCFAIAAQNIHDLLSVAFNDGRESGLYECAFVYISKCVLCYAFFLSLISYRPLAHINGYASL